MLCIYVYNFGLNIMHTTQYDMIAKSMLGILVLHTLHCRTKLFNPSLITLNSFPKLEFWVCVHLSVLQIEGTIVDSNG